jgi:hypothetical protein
MENILAGLGAVFVIAGYLMGKDNRRETLYALGGCLLTAYSISIDNAILTILLALFTIYALVHMSHKRRK